MRINFDFFTFSIIGISALSLSPVLLQLHQGADSAAAFYPVRFDLSQIPPRQKVSAGRQTHIVSPAQAGQDAGPPGSAPGESSLERHAASQMGPSIAASPFQDDRPGTAGPRVLQSPGESRKSGNLLAVQFDLGAQAEPSAGVAIKPSSMLAGTIDVRKKIRVGKAAATNIDVKLGSGANIYVNAAQLSTILETQGKALQPGSEAELDGFVSLDDLRNRGFKVRYDATGDALIVDGDV